MKRIICLLLLMFLTTPSFAADNKGIAAISDITSAYQSLNNRFYADISYPEFKDEYSNISVKVQQYRESNPDKFVSEVTSIAAIYNDINSLWLAKIDNFIIVVPNQTAKELMGKYPNIDSIVAKNIMGGWNPDSTIIALNYLAKEKIDKLALQVKALEPTYGFKYADGLIGNSIFVSIVDPKSSAYQAGLRFGDRITKVNNTPVKDVDSFTAMLSGSEGSRLKLYVKTDDAPERVIEVVKTVIPQ